jgi:hypothetical protein
MLLQVKEPDERDLHKYQTIKAAGKKIRSENLTALRWHKIRYHLSQVIIRSTIP